jgi:hypothetical protein
MSLSTSPAPVPAPMSPTDTADTGRILFGGGYRLPAER